MQLNSNSSFVSYELTPSEQVGAYSFTGLQKAGLQNLLSAAAEEYLSKPLDEDDTSIQAIKRKAYLQGQIAILKHLLELSDNLSVEEN